MNNDSKYSDLEYMYIVKDILEHEEFSKTKNIKHHGSNRFDHCLRVSYYAYKVTKFMKLDYKDVARAGLLHDFFLVNNQEVTPTRRLDVLINHPKYALINSKRYFDLNDKEEDIIRTHMFPVALKTPKYMESWIVDIVDNAVAVTEAFDTLKSGFGVALNFIFVFLLNCIK